ncbi:17754_t:CDS:10, partial [Funneliformis caledonium]
MKQCYHTSTQEKNINWILLNIDPTPIAFYRHIMSSQREHSIQRYNEALTMAIDRTSDDHKNKLISLKQRVDEQSIASVDWRLWLEEKRAALVREGIQQTNVIVHDQFNTLVTEQTDKKELLFTEKQSYESWILSTGKNVSEVLKEYTEKMTKNKEFLYPAYFGIVDLTDEDTHFKDMFSDEKWIEMKNDFKVIVKLEDLLKDEENPFFQLMDKITQVVDESPNDIITAIEKNCIIDNNQKMNAIRRLIQNYIFNLDCMPNSVSEYYFSNSFTNMITKGILTFEQEFSYDEGETESLASKMVLNLNQKPTDRSIIGQKCDFRIQKDGFEYLIGLRAGGLPEACKSKKWNDKVDLAVAMRDEFAVMAKNIWCFGLLKTIKLPQSFIQISILERVITLLLRIEKTLKKMENFRTKILIEKAQLYRNRRNSELQMSYSICTVGRTSRIRK